MFFFFSCGRKHLPGNNISINWQYAAPEKLKNNNTVLDNNVIFNMLNILIFVYLLHPIKIELTVLLVTIPTKHPMIVVIANKLE